jgi:disulfide bond formation protein DsbB
MKTSRPVLLAVAFACLALIGVALFEQHVKDIEPCPWCVIQRYAFVLIALICLVSAALPRAGGKLGPGLGLLAALAGAGAGGWLIWVQAHPAVSCGIDPLETSLNTIPTARLLPFLFRADGFCTTLHPPILGLSIPQWSFLWFVGLAIILATLVFRRNR